MARPLRIQYSGAFYHITARGNERKDIYKSKKDREKFLFYLETATERYGARKEKSGVGPRQVGMDITQCPCCKQGKMQVVGEIPRIHEPSYLDSS